MHRYRGRIWASALAAVAAVAFAGEVPEAGASVAIQLPGRARPVVVEDDRLLALYDVTNTDFVLRSPRRVRYIRLTGVRIGSVLRAAGIDPAAVPSLEIVRPDGSILYLTREQVGDDSRAAIVWVSARRTGLLRPSLGRGDINAGDYFLTSPDTPLRVTVAPGPALRVLIAGPTRLRPGVRGQFTARVLGSDDGGDVLVRWSFGDGAVATGPQTQHAFRRRGVYSVVAEARASDGAAGSSDPLRIAVGQVANSGERAGGGDARSGAATGPVKGGKAAGDSAQGRVQAGATDSSRGHVARDTAPQRNKVSATRRSAAGETRVAGQVVTRSKAAAGRQGQRNTDNEGRSSADGSARNEIPEPLATALRTGTPADLASARTSVPALTPAAAIALLAVAAVAAGAVGEFGGGVRSAWRGRRARWLRIRW